MNLVSIVVPIYNERENLRPLYASLVRALEACQRAYEILLVDDGSDDGSDEVLRQLAEQDPAVRVIVFRRNYGQSAALDAGMQQAAGEVMVLLDADLQNDPADIPRLLAKLDQGFDLVQGWRRQRQDGWINRRLPSRVANALMTRAAQLPLHDLGCTLRAMRSDVAREIRLCGDMHRFLPILAAARGARCCELVVRHHARRFGQSKYGLARVPRVLLDMLVVWYLTRHAARPMRVLGGAGLATMTAGMLLATWCVATVPDGGELSRWDWWGLGVLGSAVAGLLLMSQGLQAELAVRSYYEATKTTHYAVRKRWNCMPANVAARASDGRSVAVSTTATPETVVPKTAPPAGATSSAPQTPGVAPRQAA